MYLPLVLPFAYPILLSIYDELSSKWELQWIIY